MWKRFEPEECSGCAMDTAIVPDIKQVREREGQKEEERNLFVCFKVLDIFSACSLLSYRGDVIFPFGKEQCSIYLQSALGMI